MTAPSPAIVGVCAFTHDSSAALLLDGHLRGFAEEERLNGTKHTDAFPELTVDWLLGENDLKPESVDVVAYNYESRRYLSALWGFPGQLVGSKTWRRAVPRAASFVRVARHRKERLAALRQVFPEAQVVEVLHHRAHGLYAFASSGYEQSAVLVVDSLGEIQTTSIAMATRDPSGACDFRVIDALRDPASLGYAYGAVTGFLGWRRGDGEGTVMALAALGDPTRYDHVMEEAIRLTDRGFELDPSYFPLRVLSGRHHRISRLFEDRTCRYRHPDQRHDPEHADLAAALQQRTEEVLLHLARRTRTMTGARRLCLAGGVAMNCVAVGRIAEAGIFDEVHVPPSPADGGTAIGAAIATHLEVTGRLPEGVTDTCYLGPRPGPVDLTTGAWPSLTAEPLDDPAETIARALAEGQIVGLAQGRLEAGPRALGNRSILASPLREDVIDRLSQSVKLRERFRPFAPMVRAADQAEYFTLGQPSPYMSVASGVTDRAAREIPLVVHANGKARVQTVRPGDNELIERILDAFGRLTGVPVLVNTSFNMKGDPICGTATMALDCVAACDLDAAWIEGWWVTK